MKDEHLHLLIDEEIYLVESKASSDKQQVEELSVDSRQSAVESEPGSGTESIKDPSIGEVEKIKFAFIHNTDKPEELELLNNIINACKLEASEFRIVKEGEEISYENVVIFTNDASQFYTPLEMDQAKVLYSKPLASLSNAKDEKGKLWGALQAFVNR